MSSLIELESVSKSYRRGRETIQAVSDVSLTVHSGDFIAIVGPSGSGKTTLLNIIGCVDTPEHGTLRLEGARINELPDRGLTEIRARKIGFVFQQFFLLPTLTALENVELPTLFLRERGESARGEELLERVHLKDCAAHFPAQLSGGEMQRVAIARALINNPKILLADEPTGNLDSHNAELIMQIFSELNARGLTILMVTHNHDLARQARSVVALKDGKLSRT